MRKQVVLICFLIFALILSGCQKSTTKEEKQQNTSNLTTIRVIADSEQAFASFKMEEKKMKEKFGVKFEYYFPNRLNDNLEDFLFASGETYDIYILFPGKIPQYVERDMLLPLDDYIQADSSFEDIVPIYRKIYMNYDDHDYGVVYDGDTHLLFYRKDLFKRYSKEYEKQYGEELLPPKTWEEYDRIAKFLTRDTDNDGKIDIYGTATFSGDAKRYVWFSERFLSMGGHYFDDQMKPMIQGEAGKKALNDWIKLQSSGATPPESMYDWIDLNNVFLHGEVAMVVQWSDTLRFSFDDDTWNSSVKNLVGWSLVPGEIKDAPRGGVWIGRVMGISSQTKNKEKAWQVVQYLASEEASSKAVTSLKTINDPYRNSHFSAEGKGPFPSHQINKEFLSSVQDSLKNTNSDLMIPGGWEYMQVLDRNIGLALIKKVSAEEALNNTAAEWEKITERYGRESQIKYYNQWIDKLEEVRSP
ncbi:ABC transporter substrate-binding protein [Bacillus massilinigeriensis]|uniref:ABC transporter substrate-binding protein n=1 Tax=Bacillus massilionigeriensis TaxID=1805475 RepID=UPI00096AE9A1|nr:sugar ABC transporter substrate-binding protein [Bacillus massilionigeriensis]